MVHGVNNIPHIALTTDLASTHSLHGSDGDGQDLPHIVSVEVNENERQSQSPESDIFPHTPHTAGLQQPSHTRSPSDPAFLSPFTLKSQSSAGVRGRMSLEVPPRSPSPSYASSNEGSSTMGPPSPTLSSRSSVHFATSVDLRDNKPGDGASSLGMLRHEKKHGRKSSWAGSGHSSLEGTEPDHGGSHPPLHHATSAATSFTAASPTLTHAESLFDRGRKKDSVDSAISGSENRPSTAISRQESGKEKLAGTEENADPKNKRVELEQDTDDVNPAPFAFKPYALASMLDPKDLDALAKLGGTKGLIEGLGTSPSRGLCGKSLIGNDSPEAGDRQGQPGAGLGQSQRHKRDEEMGAVPGIVVTAPEGENQEHEKGGDGGWTTYTAPMDERRRVYGHNVLPHRASKSLLALMWLALKDKVLVRCIFFFWNYSTKIEYV